MIGALRARHAWTPASLAPFFQFLSWYDMTAPGGAFQDTAKTVPAAPGAPISVMVDLSGGGRDAVLVSGETAPTGVLDAYGALAARFAGASWLQTTPLPVPAEPGVLIASGSFGNGTATGIVLELGPNANNTNGGAFLAINDVDPASSTCTISGAKNGDINESTSSFGGLYLSGSAYAYAAQGTEFGPVSVVWPTLQSNALNFGARQGMIDPLTASIERAICGVGVGASPVNMDLLYNAVTWVNRTLHGQQGL